MQGHGKRSFLARFVQLLHTMDECFWLYIIYKYKRKKGANNVQKKNWNSQMKAVGSLLMYCSLLRSHSPRSFLNIWGKLTFLPSFVIFFPRKTPRKKQLSQLEGSVGIRSAEKGKAMSECVKGGKSWLPSRKCMVWLKQRAPESSWGRGRAFIRDGCWAGVAMCGCWCLWCAEGQGLNTL